MKISVVTVCLNSEDTIRSAIESFLSQEGCAKELIVIDGGSTDDTVTIARSYSDDGVAVISEPDEGLYDAMNKGLNRFTGDAVGFLNSDDRFAGSDCLARIASALETADMVYGHLDIVAGQGKGRVIRRWRASPYQQGAFKAGWMPAHPTFYARREVVETIGGFDCSLSVAADYDYMLQAFELHSFRSALVDYVLVEMCSGGASTRNLTAYICSNLQSHRSRRARLGVSLFDVSLFLKPLRKLPQLFRG